MKNWIIGALVVALAGVSIGAGVLAQSQRTANVEVRVWEDVNDPERNYISARPEGGSWRTLGTIPLPLTDGVSSSGRFRYGDITLAVPLPDMPDAPTATPTPSPTPTRSYTPLTGEGENIYEPDAPSRKRVWWRAEPDVFGTVNTIIEDLHDYALAFRAQCTDRGVDFYLLNKGRELDEERTEFVVTHKFSAGERREILWERINDRDLIYTGDVQEMLTEIERSDTGAFRYYPRGTAEQATFNIAAMLASPLWPNITNCGH